MQRRHTKENAVQLKRKEKDQTRVTKNIEHWQFELMVS